MAYGDYGQSSGRWDRESWSLTLGRMYGIRVRVHVLLLMCVIYLLNGIKTGHFWHLVTLEALFFVSVLLHEFGHCFGCRWVDGTADDILMWPLGGLASCDPPHRPYENLITTLAGPAVNLVIFGSLLPVLIWGGGVPLLTLLNPFAAPETLFGTGWWFAATVFKVNYWLFMFNMCLPIYPFDGGRVLQEILWFRLGYYRATLIASTFGMLASFILACVALWHQQLMLFSIMAFGFIQSFNTRRILEMNAGDMENEFGYDFSQGYTSLERNQPKAVRRGPSLRQRYADWRRKKAAAARLREEEEVDRLLQKVHDHGINSLTAGERALLNAASERRRKGY